MINNKENNITISIIIPTYNRPVELKNCLQSIMNQTVLPEEIIILDDGELEHVPLRHEFEKKNVRYVYYKKKVKGLTKSRNIGVSLSSGEIIQFFDDDVILAPNYIEETKKFYLNYKQEKLGGMEGAQYFPRPSFFSVLNYIYNVIFLITPVQYGYVTLSGFSDQLPVMRLFPAKRVKKVRILGGTSFSFFRYVFDRFRFSEEYKHGYCQGEDKDFTIRVSRDYELYLNPLARLHHLHSEVERVDKFRRGKDYVLSAHRVYVKYVRKCFIQDLLFLYSCVGLLLKGFLVMMMKRDTTELNRIKGIFSALREISKGIIRKDKMMCVGKKD